ncbi:uncharacterized protein At5g39570-like [Lolium rigidum]|uniref:uncharacterized protein At5g39570-like n=1 Tax=Lolium rigidum TaxID=89674 RepID=UPI001F5C216A|nr:uncharacterized protein At5g39570-like [Lolium rigidum]
MAATPDDDQVDDDEYYEYNPHPYGGGYDISATYGAPIPPSPSTCYPASPAYAPAASPPRYAPPPPAPAPVPRAPSSPAKPRPVSPEPATKPPPSPAPVAQPFYWPKPHDYGDDPHAPRHPTYPTPEVFRGWPYLPPPPPHCCRTHTHARCRYGPRDYWRQCMRGLDFLFGHADGYGERRIGADCHGVPVYANRKGGVEDAVVVEVPPPEIGNVQWHDAGEVPEIGSLLSWYDTAKDDTYAYANSTYGSYDSAYQQSYTQPYSVDVASDQPTSWFPNQSYQDVYKQEESQYQEVPSTYGAENIFSSQPIYCYNQHFSEQPLHVQVEPPETVYYHKAEYHENFSSYTNQTNIDNLEMSTQSREIQPYADAPLEPYQPSWLMNSGYYQASTGEVAPEYNNDHLQSGEYGDMANLFSSSSYPQQVEVYEQSYGDEYISSEQNFQNSWNVFSEDNSEITKSGGDFNHLNGSFWPFGGY